MTHVPAATTLAATPPMGWNSWNAVSCEVTEADIRAAADALVDTGLREAGYEYVVVDDCWMADELDSKGRLQPSTAFPDGMAALADYVHDRGLQFGLYSAAGSHTCQGYPATLGREQLHAEQFAAWGVDYLKYDNCGDHHGRDAIARYAAMGDALAGVDRDIIYSICEWGENRPWQWGRNVGGHCWRTTDDLVAKWRTDPDEFGLGIADVIDRMAAINAAASHGPGGWNDPDMLQIGNDHESGQSKHEPVTVHRPLTEAERRTHFAFWCLWAAPLMIGTDLTSLSTFDRELLANERLLAINQDRLGIQGTPDERNENSEVWSKRLADGGAAVAFHNRAGAKREITTHVVDTDIPEGADRYQVCDCWTGNEWTTNGSLAMTVRPRDTAIVRVTPQ